jgi:hypothetical protein
MRKLNRDRRLQGLRIKPGTSRIQCRSVNHSTITFGGKSVHELVMTQEDATKTMLLLGRLNVQTYIVNALCQK